MNAYLDAAQRLRDHLYSRFWNGVGLIGPDQGVRFNRRAGRFVKSYLAFLPWRDDYYYLQAQSYWTLANWLLHDLTGAAEYAEVATQCAWGMVAAQRPAGYWEYPHPAWKRHVSTVEGICAALALLETYARCRAAELLRAALAWYEYMIQVVGFKPGASGIAVNYFAEDSTGLVANNTTLALALAGRLAQITENLRFLRYCDDMIAFLISIQLANGELPYVVPDANGEGPDRVHFQCYQYHAFQLQDLVQYYTATSDTRVLPVIQKIAQFLSTGVCDDGSVRCACGSSPARYPYHAAALAAALGMARQLGLYEDCHAEMYAYRYTLAEQQPDGGFVFSRGDHHALRDVRRYPRPQTMILYHLLLKAKEA